MLMLLCLFCASFSHSTRINSTSEAYPVTCMISPYRLIYFIYPKSFVLAFNLQLEFLNG